jgi:hypothetical protein
MNPSSSQGTQCVYQDFSSRRRHGYIPAERIHVRISGHTGRILGLTFVMYFNHGIQVLSR